MVHNWIISSKDTLPKSLIEATTGDTLLARLLFNRGIRDSNLAKYFLDIDSIEPSSPFEIPEMTLAFERITHAVRKQEKILVYGDYDVDGTSSVALLYRAFAMIGVKILYYIPNRQTEGYGLNKEAVRKIREDMAVDLLITCDCGISNYEEISYANTLGLDVIVTDHHSIPETPPPSVANCNPKTLDSNHPLHYLPGVGVAFKLAELILSEFIDDKIVAKAYVESLLDLVALGMIADLAPLKSENRYLTIKGLRVLSQTQKPGLQELLKLCSMAAIKKIDYSRDLSNKNASRNIDINTEHIGFGLAPRINAAGRLADALEAVQLMITDDPIEAKNYADKLDSSNKERQLLCDTTLEEALELLTEESNSNTNSSDTNHCIAIAKYGWHHGIIGIVASRLVDKFHLPVFIMAIEDEITKGSVRSINVGDLDIFQEMQNIQKETGLFLKFGGHKMAAGFSCKREDTISLIIAIRKHFNEKLVDHDLRKTIKIDTCLKLEELTLNFLSRIEKLAPFGIENPQAIFITGPLEVRRMKIIGQEGKHLKLLLREAINNKIVEAVIWNRAQEFLDTYAGAINPEITVVYTPKINHFNGDKLIQLDIRDWKKPSEVNESFFDRFNIKQQLSYN